jgi:hypothetical protein
MPPAGLETTIPASARLQTHALDSAATGIGMNTIRDKKYLKYFDRESQNEQLRGDPDIKKLVNIKINVTEL